MMVRKVDQTQPDIVQALRTMGVSVFSLHTVGRGCPDLLCSYRGRWYVIEVKNGKLGWRLTSAQKRFRALSHAPVVILTSSDEAIAWVNSLIHKNLCYVEQL